MIPPNTDTHRVTVYREKPVSESGERWETELVRLPVSRGVRARISGATGARSTSAGATATEARWKLSCDPCDIEPGDYVVDDKSGFTFQVESAYLQPGPLAHIRASLSQSRVSGG